MASCLFRAPLWPPAVILAFQTLCVSLSRSLLTRTLRLARNAVPSIGAAGFDRSLVRNEGGAWGDSFLNATFVLQVKSQPGAKTVAHAGLLNPEYWKTFSAKNICKEGLFLKNRHLQEGRGVC